MKTTTYLMFKSMGIKHILLITKILSCGLVIHWTLIVIEGKRQTAFSQNLRHSFLHVRAYIFTMNIPWRIVWTRVCLRKLSLEYRVFANLDKPGKLSNPEKTLKKIGNIFITVPGKNSKLGYLYANLNFIVHV